MLRLPSRLGALICIAIMIYAMDKSSVWMALLGVVFGAWIIVPNVLLEILFRELPTTVERTIYVAGSAVIAGFAVVTYVQAFLLDPHPDAQAGLLYVFVPVAQLVAVALLLGLVMLVKRLKSR